MPSFEDNLNFIFNTENKSGSAFYINKILNLIDELEKNTEKIDTFNEPKIEIQIKNLGKILSKFKKKINSIPTKVIWIQNEAEKLCKIIKKPEDISDKTLSLKSDILADKMSFCFTNLFFINDTLEYIKKRLNLLFESNGKYYPSSVLSTLKDCLKKTEEYNILKLKHAQKKFEQSKELKDFMYGKRNPKLAHLLSLERAVPVDSTIPSKLMTPFGPVWVKRSSSDKSRMIYLIYLNQQCSRALKYDEMCEELDWKFRTSVKNQYREDAIERMIKPIIEYINQPLSNVQNFLGTEANSSSPEYLFSLVKYNYPISRYLTESQKEAAAFLCGVLLLSESHEFRNPTGGKFERKAMNNVLRLAENGCVNPFSKVFSNAKGRYIPARVGGMRETAYVVDVHAIPRRFIYLSQEMDKISQKILNAFFCAENAEDIFKIKSIEQGNYTGVINVQGKDNITNTNVQDLKRKFIKTFKGLSKDYQAVKVLRDNGILSHISNVEISNMLSELLQIENFQASIENKETVDVDDFPAALEELKQTILKSLKHKKTINKLMNNQV